MKLRKLTLSVLIGLPLGAVAALPAPAEDDKKAADPVFSGPQKGEKLLPFKVLGVWDDIAGKEVDFVAEAGEKPIFLVFVHKLTRPSLGQTRMLTDWIAEAAKDKMLGRVVWLDKDRSAAETYLTNARKSLNLRVPVGISLDGEEGPGAYGLNRTVTLTILIGKAGKVSSNFAIIQPSDTEAPKILAEAAALIGVKAPTAEDLARYGPRAMERPAARAGERDPRLATLLRQLIQKDNKPEDVTRLAGEIEKLIGGNEKLQAQLGDIAASVVGSKGFEDGGYGIAEAREQLKKWAEKHGKKRP
jgi:hypothetical protein